MQTNYHHHGLVVNNFRCFTENNPSCNLLKMNATLAERLQKARNHAKLKQGELAELAGISQQAISRLETGEQKTTTDIVQIAVACGVRPEWLAMEEGDMVDSPYVHDERLKHALKIMQQLPDYAVDDAIKELDQMAQLIKKATAAAKQ